METVLRDEMGVNEIGFDFFHKPFYREMAGDERERKIFQREARSCSIIPVIIRFIGS